MLLRCVRILLQSAAVLAHAAYCCSGGTASVSIALWSPDGAPPKEMPDWEAAVAAGPTTAAEVAEAVSAALAPSGAAAMLLSTVPKAHTTGELTSLLTASDLLSADTMAAAAEFLAARNDKDKAAQKQLKAELKPPDGKWVGLMSALLSFVPGDARPPFEYPGFAAAVATTSPPLALVDYMCSAEFLHFELLSDSVSATGAGAVAAAGVGVAEEAGGLRAGGV